MGDPRKNSEGYADPTTFAGLKSIIQEENEQQRRVNSLISVLKYIINAAGFDLIRRIELKDRKTGKEYR